jgi:hypothetical protein
MKHKLAITFIYLITAGYLFASLYILVFTGADDSLGWFQTLSEAWQTPEYEEIFQIGIASISVKLFVALILVQFIGRTKNINYCLAAIVWGLALAAWYFTPSLLINYVLGAVLVTIFSAQHLTSLGIGRS